MPDQNKNIALAQETIVLTTEESGLVLRQMTRVEDDAAMFEAQNNNLDHIAEFGNTIYATIEEATRARLEDGWTKFGIWKDDKFIGVESFKPGDDTAEVGYWLDTGYTGKGYASTATKALVDYLSTKYSTLTADIAEGNDKSIGVAERVGFKEAARHAGRIAFELKAQ